MSSTCKINLCYFAYFNNASIFFLFFPQCILCILWAVYNDSEGLYNEPWDLLGSHLPHFNGVTGIWFPYISVHCWYYSHDHIGSYWAHVPMGYYTQCHLISESYYGKFEIYTAFHQLFGSDVTSASFAFNWSRGRGAMLTHAARRYAVAQTQNKHLGRYYQSDGERSCIVFITWWFGPYAVCNVIILLLWINAYSWTFKTINIKNNGGEPWKCHFGPFLVTLQSALCTHFQTKRLKFTALIDNPI